jgi:hypothetical protein
MQEGVACFEFGPMLYVYGFGLGVSVSRLDSWTAFESPKAMEDPRF